MPLVIVSTLHAADDRHLGTKKVLLAPRNQLEGDKAVQALVECRVKLRELGLFPANHNDLSCTNPQEGFFEKECLFSPEGAYEIKAESLSECLFTPPGSKQKFHWAQIRTQPGTGFSAQAVCQDNLVKDVPTCELSRVPRAEFEAGNQPDSSCGNVALQIASDLAMEANRALRRAVDVTRGIVREGWPEATKREKALAPVLLGKLGVPADKNGKDERVKKMGDELSACSQMPGYNLKKVGNVDQFISAVNRDIEPELK